MGVFSAIGHRPSAIGHRLSAIGYRLSAIGYSAEQQDRTVHHDHEATRAEKQSLVFPARSGTPWRVPISRASHRSPSPAPSTGRRTPRAGFTLVELLVVIAIIALLMALTYRGLSSAKTARDQLESVTRLRQWGAALGSYVAEHDGDLPRRGQGVQPVAQLDRPEDWFNALPPYLSSPGYGTLVKTGRRPRAGERSIFIRPGAKDPGGIAFFSYGMNMNLSPWNLSAPTRLVQIVRPSMVVFLAESPGKYASTYPSTKAFSCQAPYDNQGDVLFLDGHVGTFDADYLGVGKGDPKRADISWLTGTASDAQAEGYR